MPSRTAAVLRARAAEARRIANNIHNPKAQLELRQMADSLDTEAADLEGDKVPNHLPPPLNGP